MTSGLTQSSVYQYLNQIITGEYASMIARIKKRNLPSVRYPEGIVYLDFDAAAIEAAGTTPEQLRADLSKYPFVVAAFLSCSGNGIACLTCTEGIESESDFREKHRAISATLSHLCRADGDAVSSRRYHYVSHDPDIFINENPVPFNN